MQEKLTFMKTGNLGYCKIFTVLLFAAICVSSAFAAPCPNCSKWKGQAYHDAAVTKMKRCKKGIIPAGCVPTLNKSTDRCIHCLETAGHNTPSGYRRCPVCFGKGEIPDKTETPKAETQPPPEDGSPLKVEEVEKPVNLYPVVLTDVKKCDMCDDNGKAIQSFDCTLCENGFNHKKDGTLYKCRVCGKVCDSRFAPCCKPDCPECGKKREIKIDCPLCGGDKVITPLEEARYKESLAPVKEEPK